MSKSRLIMALLFQMVLWYISTEAFGTAVIRPFYPDCIIFLQVIDKVQEETSKSRSGMQLCI
jgi:hypothetical protein